MIWRKYDAENHPNKIKRVIIALAMFAGLAVIGLFSTYALYKMNLHSVDPNGNPREVVIAKGSTLKQIAGQLQDEGLIRSALAFRGYFYINHGQGYLKAGTYMLSPSQSVQSIAAQLTHGKVASELIIVLPGQRIDQIRDSLVDQGFNAGEVDAALEPTQYESLSVLADKPKGANLEGYLYPESFERTSETTAADIVKSSILQFDEHMTTELKQKFANQGLTNYQALIIASIVEKETSDQKDRTQVAQVFIKRYDMGMPLGSDVTAFYGSEMAGLGRQISYDSPYNTRLHTGLPPTPISNVSQSSLEAVANPANTDWLYFVAGDDGTTHFSKTLEEHQALTKQYCTKLCQ